MASMKCLMLLLLIFGTVLVESANRSKFVEFAFGEYDLISRVATSVFDDFGGNYKIGAMVRIDVFGNFPTEHFDYGTVQITSNSLDYDSGVLDLSIAEDGVNYFAFWDTSGLSRENDYVVSVTLADKSGRETVDSDTIVALSCDPVFKNVPVSVTDVSFPSRGLPINLVRSYHIRSGYDGVFGYGWTHSYNVRLIKYPDGSVRIHEGDGSNSWFQVTPSGGYTSPVYVGYGLLPTSPTGGFERKYRNGLIERFDSSGRLESITDPNGNSMMFAYDGWLLARIIDRVGHITYLGYNDKGRISSITDPAGRMTVYEYDDFGNMASVTDPAGGVTRYAYDSSHNLVNITDAEGRRMYFEYNVDDRLASEYYEDGKNKLTYLYDENEPSVTVEDALGHQTTFIYGENNELVGVTDASVNTMRLHYDKNHNLIRIVDANSHETRFTYDDRGNALTIRDASGSVTSFTYEERFNKITSIPDALGRKTAFNYDDRGNLRLITYPDGLTEKYGYDELGNLINKTDRKGQTISYLYDSNGWLVEKTYPDLRSVAFTYDARGNLIRVIDDNGETSFDYDILDRITRVSYLGNESIEYRYDATGNRVQMIYPDGSIIWYDYDEANQLIQIKDSEDHVIVNYTYDEAGRRIRRHLENGVYTTYSYDAADQLAELVNKKSNGDTISSFSYTHDPMGNRLTMTTPEGTHHYTYDANYQLVKVTYPDGSTTTYSYDALGNRVSMTKDGATTSYVTNGLNQYISVSGTSYAYDTNGNLINGGENTYEYDYENRLIRAFAPLETISYAYDPLGKRISKEVSGNITRYVYDIARVVLEKNGQGKTVATYIYGIGIDEILLMNRGAINYYYCHDGLGNVVNLVDRLGELVESYSYDVYGQPRIVSYLDNRHMFTGIEYDKDLDFYYFRARYYSAKIGRFVTLDPLGFYEPNNRYAYVSNNPVRYTDPTGLLPRWIQRTHAYLVSDKYHNRVKPWLKLAYDIVSIFDPTPGQWLSKWGSRIIDMTEFAKKITECPRGSNNRGIYRGDPTFIQYQRQGPHIFSNTKSTVNKISQDLVARINIPLDGSLIRGNIPIFGLAYGETFSEYRLEYGEGETPLIWVPIITSTTPQTRDTSPSIIGSSADTTIIGNLGNWDTGLKNYVYLPTYPPDHPIDLNGVYTVRLVVIGKNGETVEDRVTVEVGRVIPNALGGTALSRDHKVILTVPEQSIMDSFRIISIKPIEKTTVPIVPSHKLVGDIYEFREPGEKFTKTATLQMKWSNKDLEGFTPSNLGIYTYNPETQNWRYLPTERIEEENTLITTITQITPKTAYYAILASNSPNEGSTTYKPSLIKPKPQENTQDPCLFLNTFKNGFDEWSNRDGEVGATLCLDNIATPDGTYCLKLTNKKRGGNFASNIRQTPFDAKKYPIIRFDYKIPTDVKINFLVKVSGRWYDVQFTDDPKEYRYKRVNMAGIGKIQGVNADNNWHTAEFNLYEMLRTKTRNHIVEEMIMADWDITGYMKLEFGNNNQGATYYIDNFGIWKDPEASIEDDSLVLRIDDFNNCEYINLLKGNVFTFSDNQGLGKVQTFFFDEQPIQNRNESGYSLSLKYDVSQQNSYTGYVSMLETVDLSEYQTLTFWIKGKQGGETLLVGIKDTSGHESKLLVEHYLPPGVTQEWRKVTIPLTAFTKIQNWRAVENLNFCFESCIGSEHGEVYLDNIQFERTFGTILVDDFEGRNGMNLIGGSMRAFSNGNCTISVAYDTFNTFVDSTAYRISYSGATGNLFTYSGWVTELNGLDVSATGTISFYIKGSKGGETANLYLDDGTNRACVVIEQYVPITTSWQKVTIPLAEFSNQGIDLTHLQELQIVFEWEDMCGTIWIDNIHFSS